MKLPVNKKRRHAFKTLKQIAAVSSSNVTRKILPDHDISCLTNAQSNGGDDLLKFSRFHEGVFREKDSDKTAEVCL